MKDPSPTSGPARAYPAQGLSARIRPPGDKSISHRALILGAIAEGETTVAGLLESDDVLRTAAAMGALGAEIRRDSPGLWRVRGVGAQGFHAPRGPLDFGNSGTGCRLTMGAVAATPSEIAFQGDASLSRRPMGRVLEPLRNMGAAAWCREELLPVRLRGKRPLRAISWISPQASAQVKSAVLIAGLFAEGVTEFVEPRRSRDHTERMLSLFGAPVETEHDRTSHCRRISGPRRLRATTVAVPGDPSSAAFLIAAALITPNSAVELAQTLVNPTRLGLLETLDEMGAAIRIEDDVASRAEPSADLIAQTSRLQGVHVPPERAVAMIDEYPILAVLAAYAEGATVVSGAEELRVKESDRIKAILDMLAVNGVAVEERPDGFVIHGCGPGGPPGGGRVVTHGDHRIAMSALVLGLGAQEPVEIDDGAMIATSYPEFYEDLADMGATIERLAA